MIILQIRGVRDSLRFRWSEWGCAGFLVLWGAIVAWPGVDSLGSPGWAMLRVARPWNYLPELGWGALCIGVGAARIAVLAWNGRWRRCHQARYLLALVSSFICATLIWALVASGSLSTGIAAYMLPLCLDLGTIYIASYDAARFAEARRDGAL